MTIQASLKHATRPLNSAQNRVAQLDWARVTEELDSQGSTIIEKLLSQDECEAISALQDAPFRSTIVMARHGFGKGEYKYFAYPLPELIAGVRDALYERLAPVANGWNERLGIEMRYPAKHAEFLKLCHGAGQLRPTPLLLQYGPGDYNCLHQDLYGDLAFPLQVAILLVRAGRGFFRRRIRSDRAAAAHAVTRRGGATSSVATRWSSLCTIGR